MHVRTVAPSTAAPDGHENDAALAVRSTRAPTRITKLEMHLRWERHCHVLRRGPRRVKKTWPRPPRVYVMYRFSILIARVAPGKRIQSNHHQRFFFQGQGSVSETEDGIEWASRISARPEPWTNEYVSAEAEASSAWLPAPAVARGDSCFCLYRITEKWRFPPWLDGWLAGRRHVGSLSKRGKENSECVQQTVLARTVVASCDPVVRGIAFFVLDILVVHTCYSCGSAE